MAAPSQEAQEIAAFDPRSILVDTTPHFLPTPVAALPARDQRGPPAPAQSDETRRRTTTVEQVKVANTGGVGAILRAEPPKGRQVAPCATARCCRCSSTGRADGSEWLHVQTPDGTEGWVFSRLVAPADSSELSALTN